MTPDKAGNLHAPCPCGAGTNGECFTETCAKVQARAAGAVPAAPEPMPKFNTSKAGRAEVATFFAEHLKRHDFRDYISNALAADFCCAIAPALYALRTAAAPKAAPAEPQTTGDDFLQGVCVALQHVKGSSSVAWREIVEAVGVDDMLNYAAHVEPEEWELAGFNEFAKLELGRNKPKHRKPAKAAPTVAPAEPVAQPFYIGACITDGRLHATVMQRDAKGCVHILAQAEMDVATLERRDCLAEAAPTVAQPLTEAQIANALRPLYASDEAFALALPLCISEARAVESACAAAWGKKLGGAHD